MTYRARRRCRRISQCLTKGEYTRTGSLFKLAQGAISAGAGSAPQVSLHSILFVNHSSLLNVTFSFFFRLQGLRLTSRGPSNLHRYEEAGAVLASSPKFDIDASTEFSGGSGTAYHLAVRAKVDIATGRLV